MFSVEMMINEHNGLCAMTTEHVDHNRINTKHSDH